MIERHKFEKCWLNVGKHKTIDASVCLEVHTRIVDEYAAPDPNDRPEDYIDGVRVRGELSFDSWPIQGYNHPVQKNVPAVLTLRDGEDTTKVNILLAEKNSEQVVVKDKIKRYFWLFYVVGRPVYDKLELFPKHCRKGNTLNRVFTCTDFRGLWPVGVSSVTIARDSHHAKTLLIEALKKAGINQPEMHDLTMQELDLNQTQAVVLNAGNY